MMTTRLTNLCQSCIHLHEDGLTCDAFIRKIPSDIRVFGDDHRKSTGFDNGITHELKSGDKAKFEFDSWISSHS